MSAASPRCCTANGRVDVDLLVSESDAFDALRRRAFQVTIDQRTFFVASIDDLIAMKKHAGRRRDVRDITELRDMRKRLGSM